MTIRRILEIDRRFFRDYQRQLLWIANTRLGRWYFRLEKEHYDKPVVRAFPFAMEYANEDGTFTLVTKTSDKYANRLKHTLRHVKAALLALGFGAFSRPENAVALQFLFAGVTTSFRPDPDAETTTVDGMALDSGRSASWATVRGGVGNFAEDNNSEAYVAYWLATTSSNLWDSIARGIFLFDTSVIDSASTIASATFTFYCALKTAPVDTDATKRQIRLAASNPASNTALTGTDYATVGNTSFGSLAYASITAGATNDVTLNGDGLAGITKGGITKLGTRSGADQDNSAPTWGSGDQYAIWCRTAEHTGTASDPTLTVVYSAVLMFTESATMTDTIAKQTAKTVSEAIASSDSEAHVLVKLRELNEEQAMQDTLGPKAVGKVFTDQIEPVDTVRKSVARTLIDIVTTAESFSKAVSYVRVFLETVTLRDILFFWRDRVKPTTNWTDRTPPSTSW